VHLFWQINCWAAFRAIFSQTHLVNPLNEVIFGCKPGINDLITIFSKTRCYSNFSTKMAVIWVKISNRKFADSV
jgi:hypothetical protein